MDVDVKTDFETFRKAIAHVPTDAKKQYAFALSKIGREARDAARDAFDENYIERNSFMRNSIISTTARPNRLQTQVGTYNYLLHLHLFGGKKTGNVALKGIRGDDKSGKVTRALTVKNIEKTMATKKSHRFFVKEVKGRTYIFEKTGGTSERRRKRSGYKGPVFAREPIKPMWLLRDGGSITVKPDWKLIDTVNDVMKYEAPQILADVIEDAWNHAIEKGRVPFQF